LISSDAAVLSGFDREFVTYHLKTTYLTSNWSFEPWQVDVFRLAFDSRIRWLALNLERLVKSAAYLVPKHCETKVLSRFMWKGIGLNASSAPLIQIVWRCYTG
jgi:hypothetical protein